MLRLLAGLWQDEEGVVSLEMALFFGVFAVGGLGGLLGVAERAFAHATHTPHETATRIAQALPR